MMTIKSLNSKRVYIPLEYLQVIWWKIRQTFVQLVRENSRNVENPQSIFFPVNRCQRAEVSASCSSSSSAGTSRCCQLSSERYCSETVHLSYKYCISSGLEFRTSVFTCNVGCSIAHVCGKFKPKIPKHVLTISMFSSMSHLRDYPPSFKFGFFLQTRVLHERLQILKKQA